MANQYERAARIEKLLRDFNLGRTTMEWQGEQRLSFTLGGPPSMPFFMQLASVCGVPLDNIKVDSWANTGCRRAGGSSVEFEITVTLNS